MKKHILTIDDEEEILNLLEEFLNLEGYTVAHATTPFEAKAAIAAQTPDLIITDLQLESSDGLTFIDSLRETLPYIPVVLLTGVYFDEQTIDEKLSQKISAYHNKGTPLAELLKTVRRLLNS